MNTRQIPGRDKIGSLAPGKYKTFEGTEIAVENCVKAKVKDLRVEGKTYQNLVSNLDELVGNVYTVKSNAKIKANLLKVSTTYTFIFNISEANYSYTDFGAIMVINYPTLSTNYVNISKKNGIFKVRYTIKEEIPRSISISPHANNDTSSSFKLNNLIILEGDYTNIDLPNSINGIESVLERENINLLENVEWHDGFIDRNNGKGIKDTTYPNAIYSDKMFFNKNILYATNINMSANYTRLRFYASDGTYKDILIATLYELYTKKDTVPDNINHFRILILDSKETPLPSKPYLIQDGEDINNPYPLKLKINDNTTTLNLPIPLRALPNGVADTIEGNKLVQRVGKVVCNGSEDWKLSSVNSNENGLLNIYCTILDVVAKNQINQSLICDKYVRQEVGIAYTTTEGVLINIEKRLYLRLFTSKATTVKKAKEYIKGNPFVVYYELATPIIHNLEIPNISTVRGANIITTENNIKPKLNMKVKVKK